MSAHHPNLLLDKTALFYPFFKVLPFTRPLHSLLTPCWWSSLPRVFVCLSAPKCQTAARAQPRRNPAGLIFHHLVPFFFSNQRSCKASAFSFSGTGPILAAAADSQTVSKHNSNPPTSHWNITGLSSCSRSFWKLKSLKIHGDLADAV